MGLVTFQSVNQTCLSLQLYEVLLNSIDSNSPVRQVPKVLIINTFSVMLGFFLCRNVFIVRDKLLLMSDAAAVCKCMPNPRAL